MLTKGKRVVDEKLLHFVSRLPCVACAYRPPAVPLSVEEVETWVRCSDPDHVTTRGAGGGDTAENVWPLCVEHHHERHKRGLGHMVETYPGCRTWLELAGRTDVLEKLERFS